MWDVVQNFVDGLLSDDRWDHCRCHVVSEVNEVPELGRAAYQMLAKRRMTGCRRRDEKSASENGRFKDACLSAWRLLVTNQ